MNTEQQLRLASFAPSKEALEGALSSMDFTVLRDYLLPALGEAPMGSAQGLRLWKKGSARATVARLVARHIQDPALLSEMAQKDKRISVRAAVAQNPHVEVTDLVHVVDEIGMREIGTENIRQRIHAEPLSFTLQALCSGHRWRLMGIYASHPQHTTHTLLALMEEDPGHWGPHIATRADLLSHKEVLSRFFTLTGHKETLSPLSGRKDLSQFPQPFLRALARSGYSAQVARCENLEIATLETILTALEGLGRNITRSSLETFQERIWLLLAQNPTVPSDFLRQAPVLVGTGPLGRLLAEKYPVNATAWEMVMSLQASSATSTVGELLDAVDALLGS